MRTLHNSYSKSCLYQLQLPCKDGEPLLESQLSSGPVFTTTVVMLVNNKVIPEDQTTLLWVSDELQHPDRVKVNSDGKDGAFKMKSEDLISF